MMYPSEEICPVHFYTAKNHLFYGKMIFLQKIEISNDSLRRTYRVPYVTITIQNPQDGFRNRKSSSTGEREIVQILQDSFRFRKIIFEKLSSRLCTVIYALDKILGIFIELLLYGFSISKNHIVRAQLICPGFCPGRRLQYIIYRTVSIRFDFEKSYIIGAQ